MAAGARGLSGAAVRCHAGTVRGPKPPSVTVRRHDLAARRVSGRAQKPDHAHISAAQVGITQMRWHRNVQSTEFVFLLS